MTQRRHDYAARVLWTGNTGQGTSSYSSYARDYRVQVAGKPELSGTADPAFRGDPQRHNPEDLFLAAIAGCHLLAYLALCARRGIRVLAYVDTAEAILEMNDQGGGRFTRIVLRPSVTIASPEHATPAIALHDEAHDQCFIAASCRVPIHLEPSIEVAAAASSHHPGRTP